MAADVKWTIHWNEHQWSVNDFWFCKYGNWTTIWSLWCLTDMLAAFMGIWNSDMLPAASWEWASTECQQVSASHLGEFMFWLIVDIHLAEIDSVHSEKLKWHAPCHILRMSINGASTMFSFATWVIYVSIGCRHPFVRYWQPLLQKATATCSLPHPENEHQRSGNDY